MELNTALLVAGATSPMTNTETTRRRLHRQLRGPNGTDAE
jgi:hypothetical protein